MLKNWLDMRMYRMHLFMARDLKNQGEHTLVMTGPGCTRYQDRLEALGFRRDGRFAHQEYWARSLKGMSNKAIQTYFDQAVVRATPVENIMPALQARRGELAQPAAAQQAVTTEQQREGLKDASRATENEGAGIPAHASGRPDAAGNGRSALLGKDDTRTDVPPESMADADAGQRGTPEGVPDGAGRTAGQTGGGFGEGVAEIESADSGANGQPLRTDELASSLAVVSEGNADRGNEPADDAGAGSRVTDDGAAPEAVAARLPVFNPRNGIPIPAQAVAAGAATAKLTRDELQGLAQSAALKVLSEGGSDREVMVAATDILIEGMSDYPDISISTDAPAAVEAARSQLSAGKAGIERERDEDRAEQQQLIEAEEAAAQAEKDDKDTDTVEASDATVAVEEGSTQSSEPAAFIDFDDEDQVTRFAIDREWRGLTRADLELNDVRRRMSHLLNPQNSVTVLARAESEGVTRLSNIMREQLLGFKGWGGVYQDVRTDNAKDNANRAGNRIASELGIESGAFNELIGQNRLESYWTPNPLILSIWNVVGRAGISPGGKYLEPGCGGAHFFVGAPADVQRHATLVGVERDPIAARIAKVVAPDAVILNESYENVGLASDFDAVIGNVPFGETRISDPRYPDANHVHDYFIVRSLDQLKPGGLMAVLTSSGTLDKSSDKVRQQMMERADLVAAFRLPVEAFSDQKASVTTDLLVLQKRPAGTKPGYDFTQSLPQSFVFKGEDVDLNVNQYFVDHPNHVIGTMAAASGAFGPKLAVHSEGDYSAELIAQKLDMLVQSAIPEGVAQRNDWIFVDKDQASIKGSSSEFDEGERIDGYQGFVGDLAVVDGRLMDVLDTVDVFDDNGIRTGKQHLMLEVEGLSESQQEQLRRYVSLRDSARSLVTAQADGSDEELLAAQRATKAIYDSYVEAYGAVNAPSTERLARDDAGLTDVLALELWDDEEEKVTALSDVFTKRVIRAKAEPVISDAVDAFYVCFDRKGQVDIDYIAELAGIEVADAVEALNGSHIFRDHITHQWLPATEYLSGNVVEKLAQVEASLATGDDYRKNFDALLDVQPLRVPFADIAINLGVSWIPGSMVREFVSSLFETDLDESDMRVRYSNVSGEWSVDVSSKFTRKYDTERKTLFGTDRMSFELLLEKLLNGQKPTHTYKDDQGKVRVDGEATEKSRAKQDEINARFYSWVCASPERAERIEELYNSKVNVIRLPKADGSRLSFPGLAPDWVPMPHQSEAVARAMIGYNMMAAHPVGAGKTFEMVAIAMKLKQVGKHTKPCIAVPNHMLGQIAREAKQMYPAARILMISNDDLKGVNRKRFMARARNNDWDIVVCTHSMLNQIKAPLDIQIRGIDDQMLVVQAKLSDTDSRRVERNLQARLATLESERKSVIKQFDEAASKGEANMTIDRLGIDALLVDEAHIYKNLHLNSSLNVLGVTTAGSQRADNMAKLCDYMRSLHGRSAGVYSFTGTPISNSMCELYVHNRMLRPDLLDSMGIHHFDEWAKRFGRVVSNMEALPEGGGFRINERFAQFVNVPEMCKLFRSFADVRNRSELNLPTPKVTTQIIALDQSYWQELFMKHLTRRAIEIRGGTVDKRDDNMLNIATDGRKAALDMRLIDAAIPDENNAKMGVVAEGIFEFYEKHHDIKATQLVFMDLGTPGKNKDFSTYSDLKDKLVALGMSPKEVAFMHDAKTNAQKEDIFAKVRSGDIRVLIGSTEKMGVGTNVQERLGMLWNIDCPWRPSDIEQRIGRIARRGNKFFDEVTEARVTTKDSFDLFMWETNRRKQDFIIQALTDPDAVSREFVEEMDMGHAEVMAVTTGEPRIKEKVEVDGQVAKLARARQCWEADRVSRLTAAQRCRREIAFIDARLAAEEKVANALPRSRFKTVCVIGTVDKMQDGDTTWLYATEVGRAVASRAPVIEARLMRNNEESAPLNMRVGDIDLLLQLDRDKRGYVKASVGGEVLPVFSCSVSSTHAVTGRNVRDLFNTSERTGLLSAERAQLELSLEKLAQADDGNAVWEHESRYNELVTKKRELDSWFAAQDFNKVDTGPDPFLMALAELKASQVAGFDNDLEVNDVFDGSGQGVAAPLETADLFDGAPAIELSEDVQDQSSSDSISNASVAGGMRAR